MEMAAWVVILPILLLLGLLVVGGLVLVVVLLVNPRTRPVGIVLAVLGGLLVCGVVAAAGLFWGSANYSEAEAHREATMRMERLSEDLPAVAPGEEAVSGPVTEEPTAGTSEPAESAGASEAAATVTEEPTEPAAPEPSAGASDAGGGSDEPGAGDMPTEEAGAEPAASATEPPAAASSEPPAALPGQSPPVRQARPEWVESRPQRVGDGYQMSITVGPYTSRMECDAHLPAALQAAVEEYLSVYLGPNWSGRIRLSADVLQSQLVKDQWEETIQTSVGPMVQLHVLLQFDARFRQTVSTLRDRTIVARRLWLAGTGLGVALAWLALAFAFLRIDEATAGAYRGRLIAGCILAAVVVLLVAGAVLHAAQPVAFVVERLPAVGESRQVAPPVADVLSAPAPSEQLGLARAAQAEAEGDVAYARWSLLAPLAALPLLAGVVMLLAFRRTRVIGAVLLAVVVVGALLLVG